MILSTGNNGLISLVVESAIAEISKISLFEILVV